MQSLFEMVLSGTCGVAAKQRRPHLQGVRSAR